MAQSRAIRFGWEYSRVSPSAPDQRRSVWLCRARLAQIIDLFWEHSWRISNDVDHVKAHVLRPSRYRRSFRCPHAALDPCSLHHDGVPAPNISSVTVDHDDSCELPPSEGGGSPNQCFGHSRRRTSANTGIPARTPRLRLPRLATTAELRVIDLIAQHDPKTNPEFPRRRDVGLRESLLRHLSSIEALQVRIPSDGMGCRLTPEELQERIPLFGERAQSLPLAAQYRSGSCRRSWPALSRREIVRDRPRRLPSPVP